MFRMTVRGPKDQIRKLQQLCNETPEIIEKAVNKTLTEAVRTVKKDYLSGPRPSKLGVITGRLRASATYEKARKIGGRFIGYFGTNVVYAPIHEFGGKTPPHEIVPKRKKALRFLNPGFIGPVKLTKRGKLARRQSEGAVIIVKSVRHPGSKIPPRPSWLPALQKAAEKLGQRIDDGIRRFVKK